MSKAVLISIRPKWCGLISSGKKTIEVRKTRPKLETPFKCYIYCTKDNKAQFWIANTYFYLDDHSHNAFDKCGNGAVVGEFVCDTIIKDNTCGRDDLFNGAACLAQVTATGYASGKPIYGWHISALKIYDKPRMLSEFMQCHKCEYYSECKEHEYSCDGTYKVTRPPQSFMYVEELP